MSRLIVTGGIEWQRSAFARGLAAVGGDQLIPIHQLERTDRDVRVAGDWVSERGIMTWRQQRLIHHASALIMLDGRPHSGELYNNDLQIASEIKSLRIAEAHDIEVVYIHGGHESQAAFLDSLEASRAR